MTHSAFHNPHDNGQQKETKLAQQDRCSVMMEGQSAPENNHCRSTGKRSGQLRVQDHVLESKHPQLREKLNFGAIFPHLNQHGLLPPSLDRRKLIDEKITVQERIDAIIAHVPKCGKEDYLPQFIDCLRESEAGTGTAHRELAESLHSAYVKMRDSDTSYNMEMSIAASTPTTDGQVYTCKGATTPNKGKKAGACTCLVCGLFPVMVLLTLVVIIALGTLSQVPRISQDPDKIRPLFTTVSSDGKEAQILQVDFGTDPFWVANADFEINDCSGSLLIIEGLDCSDLPTNVNEGTDSIIYFHYILPGSIVNITVQEHLSNPELQIWKYNSLGWRQSSGGLNHGPCDTPTTGSSCFHAKSIAGQTLQIPIEVADFYFFLTESQPPSFGEVEFTYMENQYNITEIRGLHNPRETSILNDLPISIAISGAFDFQQRKCVLLSSLCPGPGVKEYTIMIDNLKRRMDFLLFPGIIGIISVLMAALMIAGFIIKLVRNKRSCYRHFD